MTKLKKDGTPRKKPGPKPRNKDGSLTKKKGPKPIREGAKVPPRRQKRLKRSTLYEDQLREQLFAEIAKPKNMDDVIGSSIDAIRVEEDFSYFYKNYGTAILRELGDKPMKDVVWPFQVNLATAFQAYPRLVVCKSRQLGLSTMAGHFCYWKAAYGNPNSQNVLILSKNKDDAATLLSNIKLYASNIPPELQSPIKRSNVHLIEFENGNTIASLAATDSGGRGRVATCIILDEHAFHREDEKNWVSIQPTLEGAGHCIVISTGDGVGNLFHDLVMQAKEGRGQFKLLYLPWHLPPTRDEGWRDRERQNYMMLSEGQFKAEYSESLDEAFLETGTCPFDATWIHNRIMEAQNITNKTMFEGRATIFVKPQKDKSYYAGLDCAEGLNTSGKPDQTCLQILDYQGRHVATWAAKEELGDAIPEMLALLHMFNNPYLTVERNKAAGVIAALQLQGYDHFYRYERRHLYSDEAPEISPRVGITTGLGTKQALVRNFIEWVNSYGLISDDVAMWQECINFVQKSSTKFEARKGKDDRVMAMCLARWSLSYYHTSPTYRRARKRPLKVVWR